MHVSFVVAENISAWRNWAWVLGCLCAFHITFVGFSAKFKFITINLFYILQIEHFFSRRSGIIWDRRIYSNWMTLLFVPFWALIFIRHEIVAEPALSTWPKCTDRRQRRDQKKNPLICLLFIDAFCHPHKHFIPELAFIDVFYWFQNRLDGGESGYVLIMQR